MRKQLGVVLPLLVLAIVTAAAQTQSTDATRAALQRLNVVRGDDAISVEFTARGPVVPKLSTLTAPARVVIDLPNTVEALDQRQIAVNSDGVKGLRVGMNGQTPPSTRVVVDLEKACKYELVPGSDNKFMVKLYTGVATATAKPAVAKSVAPKAAAPAVAKLTPVSVVMPAVAEKATVAEKKEAPVVQPAAAPAPVETASSATAGRSMSSASSVVSSDSPRARSPRGFRWTFLRSSLQTVTDGRSRC